MRATRLKFLRFHCLDRHHCAVQYHHLIDRIIERFERNHPAIKIESTIMRNWYQLMYTLEKTLPTDETPDVFHTCGGGILEQMAEAGLVQDLTEHLDDEWRKDFVPATLHPLRFRGREFAVPLEQGCLFVWYNQRIFEEYGISIPGTFDELLEICRELRKRGKIPFAVGNGERWPGAFFFAHLFHRIGGEEVFVCDFTRAPNRADIRESFLRAAGGILALREAGAFPEDCNAMNYQQQRSMFFEGRAAMQLNGNRLLNYLQTEAPGIADHVSVFPFPLVEGGRGKNSTIFGGSLATYAVSARSRHREAAAAFLRCLTDARAARDVIFDMGDIPAPRHIPYRDYPSSLHGRMAEALGGSEKVQVHYFKYLSPHLAGTYLNLVAKLLAGDTSPKEAFTTLREALAHQPPRDTAP